MLVIAAFLLVLAIGAFVFDFFRSAFTSAMAAGLALFAGGVFLFVLDLLEQQGKL